ncbi:MAG: aspartate/glutamate racemase family protein [Bacteroidia bacterium]|nr:aspartate/glutamate racemase family protein [Bacteroidia bacterium]
MKTIGMIGGTSWQSTIDYYRIINQEVNKRLGLNHSARIVMFSIDFEEVMGLFKKSPAGMAAYLISAAHSVEKGGADFLILCANTIHVFADMIQDNISIPMLNIVDVTISKIQEKSLKCVGLLGTKYTMEQDFYKDRLAKQGIKVLIPDEEDRNYIDDLIFSELFAGEIKESSKNKILNIIEKLEIAGAQGIILGCTEIPLLIKQPDVHMPVFDTTAIHAMAAADLALG